MIKNPYSGKFVVIEGLDGSGQSTQAKLLKDFYIERGEQVVLTKEPTLDSRAGKKIKKILEEKISIDPLELQKLYAEDRKEHLKKTIIPSLKEAKIVISDRYFFSSFAYGIAHGANLDKLIKINDNFLYPDLIFFLKVRPEICIERIEKRGDPKTLFEKRGQLSKVWENYKILITKFENINMIDGEQSIKDVFSDIEKVVLKFSKKI
jgi:dTMP kinase